MNKWETNLHKQSAKNRTKVGKWTVDKVALNRYIQHITKRNFLLDDRDIDVKENERTELHKIVVKSAIPHIDEYDIDFQDALDEILTEECGMSDPTAMGQ